MMQLVHCMNSKRRQSDLYSKWRKLQQRINRNLETGRFYQFTKRKQGQLLKRLRRYTLQLQSLGVSVKRLALGGALALSMTAVHSVQAQTYVELTGTENPVSFINLSYEVEPALADLDGDGDLDLFVAEAPGTFKYYTNIGSATTASFEEVTAENNPLDGVITGYFAKIALADLDNDGDFDALLGNAVGDLFYYLNQGTASQPFFTPITGLGNPFNGFSVEYYSAPAFADIDGDGDLDLFVGDYYGFINFFENTGSPTEPSYVSQTGMADPFDGVDLAAETGPSLGDIDQDGDIDAFIGDYNGLINYFQNMGSSTEPILVQQSGGDNPMEGVDVGEFAKPALVDLDGDGDLDVIVGTGDGRLRYFENTLLSSVPNTTISETSVDLYPNPVSGDLVQVDVEALVSGELLLSVYDVSGRMVQQEAQYIQAGANNLSLRVAGLTAGIYQVQLQMEHEIVTKKLVIE